MAKRFEARRREQRLQPPCSWVELRPTAEDGDWLIGWLESQPGGPVSQVLDRPDTFEHAWRLPSDESNDSGGSSGWVRSFDALGLMLTLAWAEAAKRWLKGGRYWPLLKERAGGSLGPVLDRHDAAIRDAMKSAAFKFGLRQTFDSEMAEHHWTHLVRMQFGLSRDDIVNDAHPLLGQLRLARRGGTLDAGHGSRVAVEALLDSSCDDTFAREFVAMRQLLGRYVASERRRDGQRGLALRREQVEHLLRQNPWVSPPWTDPDGSIFKPAVKLLERVLADRPADDGDDDAAVPSLLEPVTLRLTRHAAEVRTRLNPEAVAALALTDESYRLQRKGEDGWADWTCLFDDGRGGYEADGATGDGMLNLPQPAPLCPVRLLEDAAGDDGESSLSVVLEEELSCWDEAADITWFSARDGRVLSTPPTGSTQLAVVPEGLDLNPPPLHWLSLGGGWRVAEMRVPPQVRFSGPGGLPVWQVGDGQGIDRPDWVARVLFELEPANSKGRPHRFGESAFVLARLPDAWHVREAWLNDTPADVTHLRQRFRVGPFAVDASAPARLRVRLRVIDDEGEEALLRGVVGLPVMGSALMLAGGARPLERNQPLRTHQAMEASLRVEPSLDEDDACQRHDLFVVEGDRLVARLNRQAEGRRASPVRLPPLNGWGDQLCVRKPFNDLLRFCDGYTRLDISAAVFDPGVLMGFAEGEALEGLAAVRVAPFLQVLEPDARHRLCLWTYDGQWHELHGLIAEEVDNQRVWCAELPKELNGVDCTVAAIVLRGGDARLGTACRATWPTALAGDACDAATVLRGLLWAKLPLLQRGEHHPRQVVSEFLLRNMPALLPDVLAGGDMTDMSGPLPGTKLSGDPLSRRSVLRSLVREYVPRTGDAAEDAVLALESGIDLDSCGLALTHLFNFDPILGGRVLTGLVGSMRRDASATLIARLLLQRHGIMPTGQSLDTNHLNQMRQRGEELACRAADHSFIQAGAPVFLQQSIVAPVVEMIRSRQTPAWLKQHHPRAAASLTLVEDVTDFACLLELSVLLRVAEDVSTRHS